MRTYKAVANLIETDLDTELVLLNPETQAMFSLNTTGRLIWQQLQKSGVKGASQAVTSQFDVNFSQAEKDTETLVASLLEAELIEPA